MCSVMVELTRPEIEKVDSMIKRLRESGDLLAAKPNERILERDEVAWLVEKAQKIFSHQPMLVEADPPIAICGDTHGQFNDLLRLFDKGNHPPSTPYLFLGDYVDRGPNGVEVICLMLAYKVRYGNKYHVLRGNHETTSINRVYGFYDEVSRKYDKELYRKFNDCFDQMPLAALVGGSIFCMHGGISPDIKSWDDVRNIKRPLTVIDKGIPCDLLWADPDDNVNGYKTSSRGISYLFGPDAVMDFCDRMNVDIIIRAHQVFPPGYQFFANKKLLTVFSAPDYCNQFNNAAGFVTINKERNMKIKFFKLAPLSTNALVHPLKPFVNSHLDGRRLDITSKYDSPLEDDGWLQPTSTFDQKHLTREFGWHRAMNVIRSIGIPLGLLLHVE